MSFKILPDETLEDLQVKGLFILQKKDTFRFGMDAVLLSSFAATGRGRKVLDLGTGTGIIPILMAARYEAEKIVGIELQPDISDMAKRSVEGNGLEDRIEIIQGDLKNYRDYFNPNSFDVVVSNPPYMKAGSGFLNPQQGKAISRHEIHCTLEDVVKCADTALKHGGELYMVHRPERLVDVLTSMRNERLEPKVLRFVCPKPGTAPNLFLIKGIKNANPGLRILSDLIIYEDNGNYTEELEAIYNTL